MPTQVREIPAKLRRLRVEEVITMAEAGIIAERERLELVDGRLIEMSPEGREHAAVVSVLTTLLAARVYPAGFQVGSQSTLPLGEHSYLEPDVYVARPKDPWGWPASEEVALVAEVAQTSARRDRTEKAALYAAWGARVYWIVDLNARAVVVHTDPRPDGYGTVRTVAPGEIELPGIEASISLAEFLPPS